MVFTSTKDLLFVILFLNFHEIILSLAIYQKRIYSGSNGNSLVRHGKTFSDQIWPKSEIDIHNKYWNNNGGTPWATAEEEAKDEARDPELFHAVVESIRQWEAKHKNHSRHKRAEASICYPDVGCFRDSGYIDMLPSPPTEVATRFLLYSSKRSRRSDIPLLDVSFINMTDAVNEWAGKAFNMSAPTKVIVHGFGSSCTHIWVYEMRSALMTVENCNVICVDWENGATFPNYVRASANTRMVGRQLSMLLKELKEKHGMNLGNVHIIGFSLGAHAAAFAGAELGGVKRITGLDPAGPLFESQEITERLDSSDASFVDVIHSNGETLILGGLGSWAPMGHVDFYPNGGRMQKGCSNLFVGAVSDFISGATIEARSLCNHRRAYKFFTDSVSPRCQFPAVPCKSYEAFLMGNCFPCSHGKTCPNMGYYADMSDARGSLYLITRDEEPFCAHQYLVRVESTPSALPVTSYGKIQMTLVTESQFNETFTLTQKDDEELVVGGSLSKIIVPHPALQEFTQVTLLYTAYAGWISSGLAKWSIDKITLLDSFGNILSVCKPGFVLESGKPQLLPLKSGDCNKSEDNTLQAAESRITDIKHSSRKYQPTQVVYVDDDGVTHHRSSNSTKRSDLITWNPIMPPSIPEKTHNRIDDGRRFRVGKKRRRGGKRKSKTEPYEFEKITTEKPIKNSSAITTKPEIKEPVLAATTPKFKNPDGNPIKWIPEVELSPPAMGATESWQHWEGNWNSTLLIVDNVSERNSTDDETDEGKINDETSNISSFRSFTVHLIPNRLATLLEQAQQYARLAIAPFIGGNSNNNNGSERTSRRFFSFSWPNFSRLRFLNFNDEETTNNDTEVLSTDNKTRDSYLPLNKERYETLENNINITMSNKINKTDEILILPLNEKDVNNTDIIVGESVSEYVNPTKQDEIIKIHSNN